MSNYSKYVMKQSDFSLIEFPSAVSNPGLKIAGSISRQLNQLNINYVLSGDLSAVVIPPLAIIPSRQYNLWSHTCFELFLGLKDSTKYWEFNLSPTRDWNVFCFPDYRQHIAEEIAFSSLPFTAFRQTDSWQLNLEIDLNKIITVEQDIEVGISTVIENQDQQFSYWALKHPATAADFHHRDSFIISL